jgi:hypothetical protein
MSDKPAKWRWAFYGFGIGLAIVVISVVLQETGYVPWLRPGIVRNLGFSGTLLVPGVIGYVAGLLRDRRGA